MVLFVSCFLNSCQKEEILEIQDNQTIIQKRTISFEELNVKLNKYTKFTTHQERADGDEFITSLETDNIIEFETQDETTYTLKANTTADNETGFTNIIFVEKNEQLEKYLLKYEPTEAWKTARLTDVNILYSGHIIILDFDGNVLAESEVVAGVTVSKRTSNMACYAFEGYTDIFFETYYVLVEVPCEDEEPEDDEIDEGDSGDGGGTTDTSNDGNDSNGSGTGNDNGDNSNDNGTGDNTNTGDDGTPIFTEPVLGDNDGDPEDCNRIQAQLDDFSFKQKFDELKALTGDTVENGNYETSDDLFIETLTTPNGLSVYNLSVSLTRGYMHTHVDEYESGKFDPNGNPILHQPIKIFSPRDIGTFLEIARNSNFTDAVNINEVYGMVITSGASYTIKFNGDASAINLNFGGINLKNKYKKRIKRYGKERGLLLFLKNDMNVEGISLYKIKNNGRIKELRLKPNGNIERIPCS